MAKQRSDSEWEGADNSFGLDLPSEQYESFRGETKGARYESRESQSHSGGQSSDSALHDAEIKYKAMGWKGVDADDELEELEDNFGVVKKPIPEDELDMTPMVDVTFLLLIFFMVTASFTMQKSLEQPKANIEEAPPPAPAEIDMDFIEIAIDQNNNYYITSSTTFEKEAPSVREMRELLRDAQRETGATKLIIKAHMDSFHKSVVTAWDAGISSQFTEIQIKTTEQDY